MRTFRINLIRHGKDEKSGTGRYIGHTDSPLSEEGKNELETLMSEYSYPEAEVVVSGPLSRCKETAQYLYPEKEAVVFQGLAEYDFGEFEDKTAEELAKYEEFGPWLAGSPEAKPPFGESNEEFQRRVCSCFFELVEGLMKAGIHDSAVITHGGVIMTIMHFFAIPEANMTEWQTDYGCGYTLLVTPSLWGKIYKAEAVAQLPLTVADRAAADRREQDEEYYYGDVDDGDAEDD